MSKLWGFSKKALNLSWKLGVVTLAVTFAILGVCEYKYELSRYFHPWEALYDLSDNVVLKVHNRKLVYGLFDANTGKRITSKKFKMVYEAADGDSLTVFVDMHHKRGFLNVNTGKIEIPAQYKRAWVFSEGVAAVVTDDDSLRLIGRDGSSAFPKAFQYDANYDYVFHNGKCIMSVFEETEKRTGMIDKKGEWIVPQEYEDIQPIYYNGYRTRNYLLTLKTENKESRMGILDENCKWLFPPEYQDISLSDCDNTLYLTKDYVKSHVTACGEVLQPFVVDYVDALRYEVLGKNSGGEDDEDYTKTVTSDKIAKYSVNGLLGIFDLRTSKPLTKACFSDIYVVSGNVVRCQLEGSVSEVLYDINGKRIL